MILLYLIIIALLLHYNKQICRYEVRKGTDGSLYGSVKKIESIKLQNMERDQRKRRGDGCLLSSFNKLTKMSAIIPLYFKYKLAFHSLKKKNRCILYFLYK